MHVALTPTSGRTLVRECYRKESAARREADFLMAR
jgi:hypothetical protein